MTNHACSPAGTVLLNVLDGRDSVTVSGGMFRIDVVDGMPKVYIPQQEQDVYGSEWVVLG